jgi:hypothetical protein
VELQIDTKVSSALKMEAVCPSKMMALSTNLNSDTTQKADTDIFTAVRTSCLNSKGDFKKIRRVRV